MRMGPGEGPGDLGTADLTLPISCRGGTAGSAAARCMGGATGSAAVDAVGAWTGGAAAAVDSASISRRDSASAAFVAASTSSKVSV